MDVAPDLELRIDRAFASAVQEQLDEERQLRRLIEEVERAVATLVGGLDDLTTQVRRAGGPEVVQGAVTQALHEVETRTTSILHGLVAGQPLAIRAAVAEVVAPMLADAASHQEGVLAALHGLRDAQEDSLADLRYGQEDVLNLLREGQEQALTRLTTATRALESAEARLADVVARVDAAADRLTEMDERTRLRADALEEQLTALRGALRAPPPPPRSIVAAAPPPPPPASADDERVLRVVREADSHCLQCGFEAKTPAGLAAHLRTH